jgi:electron transport complex protein RnfC
MLEHPDEVIEGVKAAAKALGIDKAHIAIEDNKRDAIEAIEKAARRGGSIKVDTLRVKYPQGAEKQLIYALTKRHVPSGKLPMDVGTVVINAGTAYQIALAINKGLPLYERVITVTGSVKQPSNFLVRIGTPISYVIEQAGGFAGNIEKVIAGGPMMGIAQANLDAPVMKGTSGILVLNKKQARIMDESACICCGKCINVCPMGLEPYLINNYASINDFKSAEKFHAMDCMECGGCTYICPANRQLTQRVRLAKAEIIKSRKAAGK